MGIVEEAIVLLLFYFSASAPSSRRPAFTPVFFLRRRFLPFRFQRHYMRRSAVSAWIVSRNREEEKKREEKSRQAGRRKRGQKGAHDERRDWGG